MLKADGPDWQKVLGYVESIFRHFEMWSRFLSSSAWLFFIPVTGAEGLKHFSTQEGAQLTMNWSARKYLDFMVLIPSHRTLFADTQVEYYKFFYIYIGSESLNQVMMHKTPLYLIPQ